ncbi:MAG: GNAT family N-acetyltransferase, partial [Candidatus Bathyarchaeota archaeon]|nr:GNAT family N-acetyltransferase [Candidatus Bathyarchaeota archaeon]
VKHGLTEIIDLWVRVEERRKGIGGKLIDHAIIQMEQYYKSHGVILSKVMLFTGASDRFLAARNLYEKKRFRVVATIPKNALDNPYGDDLLYVLQI